MAVASQLAQAMMVSAAQTAAVTVVVVKEASGARAEVLMATGQLALVLVLVLALELVGMNTLTMAAMGYQEDLPPSPCS